MSTSFQGKTNLLLYLRKPGGVCDLSTTRVLSCYSFLCFWMGPLNASLIKSASPSSGLLLCGKNRGSRCREEGEELVPSLTFLGVSYQQRRSSLLSHQAFKQLRSPLRFTATSKTQEK